MAGWSIDYRAWLWAASCRPVFASLAVRAWFQQLNGRLTQFSPIADTTLLLALAAGLGALTLAIFLLLLRYLRQYSSDSWRRRLDRQWPEWEAEIHRAFLFYGRLEEEMLPTIPLPHRAEAMQRYVQSRTSDALVYHVDPPRVELTSPKHYKAFLSNWKAAWEMVENEDTFRSISALIVHQLCDLLGFTMVDSRTYRNLVGYMMKAPSLRLNVPPRFPIIFMRRREFGPEDVTTLINFMGILGITSFFALLIDLNDYPEKLERRRNLRSLVQETIHDFIILDGTALRHIMMAKNPERRLIDIILGQVDLTVVSPYVTSGPVPENMFFGRDNELKTITRKIKDASFALVGGRKIGKTSTLSKVYRMLAETMDHFPLYLDCQPVRDHRAFFEAITAIWEVRLADPTPQSFRQMVVNLAREWRRGTIVILLDEVDALLQYDLQHQETLFRVFRALSQEARCRFVFCGERVLDARLHAPDSPLFNFCDVIHLSYLDRKSARRIIQDPMADMGIEFEDLDTAVMQIMDFSSCHPNIVQYICQRLIQAVNARGARVLKLADLTSVAESGSFREYLLEVVWGNATALEKMISLLMIPQPETTWSQIAQELQELDVDAGRRELEEALQGLYLYSIVHKEPSGYIFDHLMFPKVVQAHLDIPTFLTNLAEEWRQSRSVGESVSGDDGQGLEVVSVS